MSEILCEKHGMVSAIFVSPKLAKTVSSRESLDLEIVTLTLHLPFDKIGVFSVDQEFIQEHGDVNEIFDEEVAFEIYDELVPVCPECYK